MHRQMLLADSGQLREALQTFRRCSVPVREATGAASCCEKVLLHIAEALTLCSDKTGSQIRPARLALGLALCRTLHSAWRVAKHASRSACLQAQQHNLRGAVQILSQDNARHLCASNGLDAFELVLKRGGSSARKLGQSGGLTVASPAGVQHRARGGRWTELRPTHLGQEQAMLRHRAHELTNTTVGGRSHLQTSKRLFDGRGAPRFFGRGTWFAGANLAYWLPHYELLCQMSTDMASEVF